MHENLDLDPADIHRSLYPFITELDKILNSYTDVIDNDYVREIQETLQSLQDAERNLSEKKLLHLGIVGQVNSGKSTLLNVLLFKGAEVLPQAATPMTASVTNIQWSEQNKVEVEFYSQTDWEEFGRGAEQYKESINCSDNEEKDELNQSFISLPKKSIQLKASYELVEMAKAKQIRVHDYLGKTESHETKYEDLPEILRNIVGPEGKLTPLVKRITIKCNHGIEGLEVIDTPGINDPVVSRSRKTKEYLKNCDSVMMLSYACQFMEAEDMIFFQQSLPASGIRKKLILGSKFDSALIDVSYDHGSNLQSAIDQTVIRLKGYALQVIDRNDRLQNISDSECEIEFVAARCSSLIVKPPVEWNEEETEEYKNLCEAYPNWFNKPVNGQIDEKTKEQLNKIGNMSCVEKYIKNVRDNKLSIKKHKAIDYIEARLGDLDKQLVHLEKALDGHYNDLDRDAIQEAKNRIDRLESLTENIKDELQEEWNNLLDSQMSQFTGYIYNAQREKRIRRDELGHHYTEKTHLSEEDFFSLWDWIAKILGIGGNRKQLTYTEIVENKSEIRNVIDDYIDCVREGFEKIASSVFQQDYRDIARNKMKEIILVCNEVDGTTNLDIEKMERLIWRAVGRLCESAKENLKQTNDELFEFTGGSEGADELLRSILDEESHKEKGEVVLKKIVAVCRDLSKKAEKSVKNIGDEIKENLIPEIALTLESEAVRLELDIQNREFKRQRYSVALDEIKACKAHFKEVSCR